MKHIISPKKGIWLTAIILISVGFLSACISKPGSEGEPTIENNWVKFSGEIVPAGETSEALVPEGSRITVQILDTSKADTSAIVLSEINWTATESFSLPTPYRMMVPQADLEKAVQASFAVRIEDGEGKLLYINDTIHLVSADQKSVDIAVIAVENNSDTSSLPPAFNGQVWQWIAFQDSADGEESNDISVDDPASYTLELLPDGTYALKADCNFVSGQYTLNNGSLSFDPGAMTLAECGPESFSNRFVALLGDVVTYVFNAEGNLVLNLKMDAGDMIFVRAQPNATPQPQPTATVGSSSILLNSSDSWRGVGRININSSCTAVLIDTGAGDAAPAFVLTNGHCVEWLANGAITNQQVQGEVLFNYFADTSETTIAIPLAEIAYSSMQGSDIAIIRLDTTLGELAKQKIIAFPIAKSALDSGSQVRVVGAPSSGLEQSEAYLREEICQIREQVDLLEFNWHFYDHYATDCQDIYGGSSGSPLFSAETNTIYGLVNTTVKGSSACYLGVPCEISSGQIVVNKDASYATPIHELGACFTDTGDFNLSADCPLPSPEQLSFTETVHSPSQPPLTWKTTLAGDLPYYRYKAGPAGVVDCRLEQGYSSIISLAKNPLIDDPIPDEEGFYLLCVQAGKSVSIDETWQNLAYPTVEIAQIDTTPPQLEPQLGIRETPDYFDVSLLFIPPELSDYLYKFGPPETTDCAIKDDYNRYRRISISLERGDGPIRLCVIGFDNADNATQPLDKVFDE